MKTKKNKFFSIFLFLLTIMSNGLIYKTQATISYQGVCTTFTNSVRKWCPKSCWPTLKDSVAMQKKRDLEQEPFIQNNSELNDLELNVSVPPTSRSPENTSRKTQVYPVPWKLLGVLCCCFSPALGALYLFTKFQSFFEDFENIALDMPNYLREEARNNQYFQELIRVNAQKIEKLVLERIVVFDEEYKKYWRTNMLEPGDQSRLSDIAIDKSGNLEFHFILDYLVKNNVTTPHVRSKFILDLGPYDGYLESNSYNFFELGWNGLLVELNPKTYKILKETITNLKNTYGNKVNLGKIEYENCGISNGTFPPYTMQFCASGFPQSSNIKKKDCKNPQDVFIYPIKELLERHKVPKKFAIADIDVESETLAVTMDIIENGWRPFFIIVEIWGDDRDNGLVPSLEKVLFENGYVQLTRLRQNNIYILNETSR